MTTTAAVDSTFIYIIAFCILLFAIIFFSCCISSIRYRRSRNPNPPDIWGQLVLEAVWIAASVVWPSACSSTA